MSSNKTKPWYLYVIRCEDGSLYTGITTDVNRRFSEHQDQGPKCAKYLRGKNPLELVLIKKFRNRSGASSAEIVMKKLSKKEKETIIVSGCFSSKVKKLSPRRY